MFSVRAPHQWTDELALEFRDRLAVTYNVDPMHITITKHNPITGVSYVFSSSQLSAKIMNKELTDFMLEHNL